MEETNMEVVDLEETKKNLEEMDSVEDLEVEILGKIQALGCMIHTDNLEDLVLTKVEIEVVSKADSKIANSEIKAALMEETLTEEWVVEAWAEATLVLEAISINQAAQTVASETNLEDLADLVATLAHQKICISTKKELQWMS